MHHQYFNQKTNELIAIESLNDFCTSFSVNKPIDYYTIFIITKAYGGFTIDENQYSIDTPMVLFLSPGQHFNFDTLLDGFAILFNKEFYCIEYHDNDVSCNGLLFVNNLTTVQIELDDQLLQAYTNIVNEMVSELQNDDTLKVEMLKNILKNLLIRSNRLFKSQNISNTLDENDFDFSRKFSQLVENNYRVHKQVETYAEMMGLAPASLTKKLQKHGIESPSRIIKNRIITEAKRLLLYTDKSIKEIASIIGYDDQHYFSRLFTKEAGISPSNYKKSISRN